MQSRLETMPPIPDPLHDETLLKLDKLSRRIGDAQSFQVARLRSYTGSVAVQQQYAAELREDIESYRRELEILETFVDDIRNDEQRKEIYSQLDALLAGVEQLKKDFRAALLASKRAIDSQARSQRDELLRSSVIISGASKEKNDQSSDALMNASAAVTEALRRTTALMQQELERSDLSTQMLEESTQTMTTTSDLYSSFSMLLNSSKTLVIALEKADWLDRLLMLLSLGFFFLAVAYIIKKRVIDKGFWLAFWWVRYIPLPRQPGGLSPTSQNALSSSPPTVHPLASSDISLVSTSAISATAGAVSSAFTLPYGAFPAPPHTTPSNTIEQLTEVTKEARGVSIVEDGLGGSMAQWIASESESLTNREVPARQEL